jgi:acetyl esterase/lipase
VQFVRAQASPIDPDRIALMGDGGAAQLAALVTLANAEPQFSSQYKDDANAGTPATRERRGLAGPRLLRLLE